ncbi:MAG TPA: hypothetical protein VGJ13_17255 [Pseudonocardiaceae bacterium]|jgi:hypothetical protein
MLDHESGAGGVEVLRAVWDAFFGTSRRWFVPSSPHPRVGGYSPLDVDAYRGSRADYLRLLGLAPGPGQPQTSEDAVALELSDHSGATTARSWRPLGRHRPCLACPALVHGVSCTHARCVRHRVDDGGLIRFTSLEHTFDPAAFPAAVSGCVEVA